MRKREALRRLRNADATTQLLLDTLQDRHADIERLEDECDSLRTDLGIAETALESERQWRLTSLPTLLSVEERAVNAEAEVARLQAHAYVNDSLTRCFPELRTNRALAAIAVGGVVVVLGGLAAAFLAGSRYQQHASARLARIQVAPLRGFLR